MTFTYPSHTTKGCVPLSSDVIDTRLKELLLAYAANISVDIMEMEIMPDHVHILMEVDPQFAIL